MTNDEANCVIYVIARETMLAARTAFRTIPAPDFDAWLDREVERISRLPGAAGEGDRA